MTDKENTERPIKSQDSEVQKPGRSKWFWLLAGLLLGALLLLGIRFINYESPQHTHFHANFGVYVNGERETFEGGQYYEEVNLCALNGSTPESRVHLHSNVNDVIHVHADAVTWGHFFTNIGWVIGPDFVRTPDQLYVADGDNRLNIVLNGDNLTGISSIVNQTIDDKDRLLVSYGDADTALLDEQFGSITRNAGEYNSKPDPAACAGGHDDATLGDRLRSLF